MSPPELPTATDSPLAVDTVERLAHMNARGHPILSLYLDFDPRQFPTPDSRDTELGALLDHARQQAGGHETGRVIAWLHADRTVSRGSRGLAIFSSASADIFEVVRLPIPVAPLAVVDAIPWLEPLAASLSPGDWAVAVVSRRSARLLRGGPQGLTEFATIDDELHGRHAQGGWSQARFQRGIEEQVAIHIRGVVDRLFRAHQRRPFRHVVLVCAEELRPVIERNLHPELRDLLCGTVDGNLEHATVDEIVSAVAPVVERTERNRERDLVARLDQALGTSGPAAAGLDDVLSSLEQEQVAILLIPEHAELTAGLCPTCGRLSTDDARTCPLDGHVLGEVNAVEYAIEAATRQSAEVVVSHHEQEWLGEHGQLAALLRW